MIQPDKIIRTNRKTLAVCISPTGTVTVRAPITCDTARIFAFLEEKQAWILRQKQKREHLNALIPTENLDGFAFLLFGKQTTLHLHDGKHIHFDETENILLLPKTSSRRRLEKWLKENALRIFSSLTQTVARRMGVEYKSVQVTSAKTRWGSCSGNNALHYSFRLIYAPKSVISYVITHELAHVKHKNHSKRFWREVEKYDPDYKTNRAWLKSHAYLMEIF